MKRLFTKLMQGVPLPGNTWLFLAVGFHLILLVSAELSCNGLLWVIPHSSSSCSKPSSEQEKLNAKFFTAPLGNDCAFLSVLYEGDRDPLIIPVSSLKGSEKQTCVSQYLGENSRWKAWLCYWKKQNYTCIGRWLSLWQSNSIKGRPSTYN